ncbi:4-hydroxy-tetrahydrodipicolinate synthase [Alicyclobacillaceae bacterium I2511]|jgi:4-hydroxy-tetrahydrodipicolinate synthase|nr:4-hydroxy-tetrahydrodipicolinate synthase [Alicyclobacillaceae bacterium I2511]
MIDFGRLMTAMATPFTEDGRLDGAGLQRLVDHLITTGTTAIVAAGTTGESPVLSHAEKLRLFELTLRYADGRVPVLAGTGTNATEDSIQLSREAEKLGVQGLLLVSPYYNKPTQEGLYAHFTAIAKAVSLPIMVYNIPSRCGVNIEVNTLLRLAQVPNIVAIKEASGNMNQIMEIAAFKPDDVFLYSGDDKLILPVLAVGGYGVVSVASHLVGTEITQLMEAYLCGDVTLAAKWSARLLPLFEALFHSSSPAPLKSGLRDLGLPAGGVRLPLVEAPEAVQLEVRQQLEILGKQPSGLLT